MSAEKVIAVYVEHEAEKCPAEDPERANVVVPNLREAQPLVGVFIPPRHKGVSLLTDVEPEAAAAAHSEILPDHLDPIAVELEPQVVERIAQYLENPELLDEIDAQHEFLLLMSRVPEFSDKGLQSAVEDLVVTKSLAQLPDFIAEKIAKNHGVTV
jgi:hypothetical protein